MLINQAKHNSGLAAGRPALIGYATIKLLLVLVFIASLMKVASAASEHSPEVCDGRDIVAELASNDSAVLQRLRSEAADAVNADSILWRISRAGIADSWLFGTMHMADPMIATLPEPAAAALDQSQTVLIENVEATDRAGAVAALVRFKELSFYLDGSTVETRLGDDLLPALGEAAEQRGIPSALAVRMRPWLLATALAVPVCELARKQAGEPVLDAVIAAKAADDGKRLIGLETSEEQFRAAALLPERFHVAALEETLRLGPRTDDVMATIKGLYIAGDIAMIDPLMRHVSRRFSAGDEAVDFRKRLVHDRNRVMAKRAQGYLADGGVFMAVGALHLPGSDGVVALLREQGFAVEPVETHPQSNGKLN